ncbi:insulin receptor substrate 1 chico isoform X2 [Arctopsyche grandis]|uniref:insulin receptor substrate 1 chico isoform X2 n=1 Tax=Arctopsyche grandis TaxID=121162 RepID=UPI00406D902B
MLNMESSRRKDSQSGEVVRQGYLKKLKTMKKKYFVLKSETSQNSARLEYYDSEKKWKSQGQPKKVISLKSCFNITRRLDTRHKHVIALYTKDECLCVVLDSEEDLAGWLQALLSLLHGENAVDDQPHSRQHVWQVNVQKKGLGASRNILGLYNLCLTDKKLFLVKIRPNVNTAVPDLRFPDTLEFSLTTIRRCGDSECFFYMEVGRSSVTGAGELWMHTEDQNIAQSMHSTILNAMSSRSSSIKEELGPKTRNRSSSANEASKPISVLTRRQTHAGSKSHGLSPSSAGSIVGVRERCDSLPSRGNTVLTTPRSNISIGTRYSSALRPHSMFVHGIGQSPPVITNSPLSPNSGACSTDSAGSSMSIDETDNFFHHSMTPDDHLVGMIPEEVADETLGIWQPEKCDLKIENTFDIVNNMREQMLNKSQTLDSFDGSSPVPIVGTPNLGDYMPMSPATMEPLKIAHSLSNVFSANHSRTSSVNEDMSNFADSQLASSISKTNDYVDMEPSKKVNDHAMSPNGSFCSVVSSTPSNDIRFSEYHLEKVSSYFTPNEDKENRPARAYSVGSRPEHITKIITRPETLSNATDAARARAFSVGSRSKVQKDNRIFNHGTPPHCHLHHLNSSSHSGYKSSSAPLLAGTTHVNTSSRYLYNSNHSSVEPLDMMEMDFSNRTVSSSSVKTNNTPDAKSHAKTAKVSLSSSASKSSALPISKIPNDGYVDMSPIGTNKAAYVEMKSTELVSSGSVTPKAIIDSIRKISISKSPPASNIACTSKQATSSSEGYVEMTWNNAKAISGKSQSHSRVSSLPIAIHSNNAKDIISNPVTSSSTSPTFNSSILKKCEEDNFEGHFYKGISPKASPSASPITPVNPSPFPSLRRHSKKHHMRRNSKEISSPGTTQSPTFPFNPTSPVSPIKPITQSVALNFKDLSENKNAADPSCSSTKISNRMDHEAIRTKSWDMENLRGLTTVREINESGLNKVSVDKDTKQLINNATKELDFNMTSGDLSDYINLNPNATVRSMWAKRQKSVDDPPPDSPFVEESSESKSKFIQNSQPIVQNIYRKVPTFSNNLNFRSMEVNAKENQSILSSNPLANKNMFPLTNTNISNINQVPNVRKPILVTITGQIQPNTANFKPIPSSDFSEPRCTKSSSPKPVESVLNRQLTSILYDNKNTKSDSLGSCNRTDGYEILAAQNGKHTQSRPNSVNKCKKGNGCSSSRPPSVTSQGELSGGNGSRSRPSSVSSELSNTPTNSRPASVTGEREGSSRGLHYASLELDHVSDRSPRPPPTPIANRQTFSYAQIDFGKSEELKNSKNLSTKTKN